MCFGVELYEKDNVIKCFNAETVQKCMSAQLSYVVVRVALNHPGNRTLTAADTFERTED